MGAAVKKFPLIDLPDDILYIILQYIDGKYIYSCMTSCTKINNIMSMDVYWKSRLAIDFKFDLRNHNRHRSQNIIYFAGHCSKETYTNIKNVLNGNNFLSEICDVAKNKKKYILLRDYVNYNRTLVRQQLKFAKQLKLDIVTNEQNYVYNKCACGSIKVVYSHSTRKYDIYTDEKVYKMYDKCLRCGMVKKDSRWERVSILTKIYKIKRPVNYSLIVR